MPVIVDGERPKCRICGVKPVSVTGTVYKGKRYYSHRCSSCRGKRSAEDRFFSKVEKTDTCWLWTGARNKHGYGNFGIATNKMLGAHIWAYRHFKGPTDGLFVCHHCDNPACVNPDHLWLGTNADNLHDSVAKDRHCRGERSPNAKLTDELVLKLRQRHKNGASYIALARQYGVAPNTIKRAVTGDGWKHVKEEQ